MVRILGGCDCGRQVILKVEAVFPGREIDRRVLAAEVDAEFGLITCVWRWPDCPFNSGVAHGFGQIPVSVAGEGVQVGGGVEQKEEKNLKHPGVTWHADGVFLRMRAEDIHELVSP